MTANIDWRTPAAALSSALAGVDAGADPFDSAQGQALLDELLAAGTAYDSAVAALPAPPPVALPIRPTTSAVSPAELWKASKFLALDAGLNDPPYATYVATTTTVGALTFSPGSPFDSHFVEPPNDFAIALAAATWTHGFFEANAISLALQTPPAPIPQTAQQFNDNVFAPMWAAAKAWDQYTTQLALAEAMAAAPSTLDATSPFVIRLQAAIAAATEFTTYLNT